MNFDEKYNKILSKIDSLINEDYNPKNIKKCIVITQEIMKEMTMIK